MIEPLAAEELSDVAAIFEFDGVLFHPDSLWKIRDIRLGVLGSRIGFMDAFAKYQQFCQTYPDALLTDCFTIDDFEYPVARQASINITPPEVIAKTASNHIFRGHQLIFLSFSQHRELQTITERLIGELRFPVLKNPFEDALHYYPANNNFEEQSQSKFELLKNLLETKDSRVMNRGADEPHRYSRIHFYYTDQRCASLLNDYLRDSIEILKGGRNAVVFSNIARLS